MDFLEILKNSSNNKEQKRVNKPINIIQTPEINEINNISTYKNIKSGDFIKIIYQPNSILNTYKGYIGEIKNYRKEQESALVFLHAIAPFQLIKFPISHFVKID